MLRVETQKQQTLDFHRESPSASACDKQEYKDVKNTTLDDGTNTHRHTHTRPHMHRSLQQSCFSVEINITQKI